jgi:hypothetical protein|tara:strand:+ start:1228 stop:1476 length:249 start_codon:yes stop_codon:yes gene_type:complete
MKELIFNQIHAYILKDSKDRTLGEDGRVTKAFHKAKMFNTEKQARAEIGRKSSLKVYAIRHLVEKLPSGNGVQSEFIEELIK